MFRFFERKSNLCWRRWFFCGIDSTSWSSTVCTIVRRSLLDRRGKSPLLETKAHSHFSHRTNLAANNKFSRNRPTRKSDEENFRWTLKIFRKSVSTRIWRKTTKFSLWKRRRSWKFDKNFRNDLSRVIAIEQRTNDQQRTLNFARPIIVEHSCWLIKHNRSVSFNISELCLHWTDVDFSSISFLISSRFDKTAVLWFHLWTFDHSTSNWRDRFVRPVERTRDHDADF